MTGNDRLHVGMALLATVFALSAAQAQESERRLVYNIECLHNAASATRSSPGDCGTENAFRLVHTLGDWSRFNWPRFAPAPGTDSIVFSVRGQGMAPKRVIVRVRHRSGAEWQSDWVGLTAEWRSFTLRAPDFRLFRGGEPETTPPFSLSDAVQFQIVPDSSGVGEGVFLVDEISVRPNGPSFTAEAGELEVVPDTVTQECGRLRDLSARWRFEEGRLREEAMQAGHWLRRLREARLSWTEPPVQAAFGAAAASRGLPWQTFGAKGLMSRTGGRVESSLTRAEYDRRIDEVQGQPEKMVIGNWQGIEASSSRLYDAVEQLEPVVAAGAAGAVLRQTVQFTSKPTRQTVFTDIPQADPIDVTDRTVVLHMRMDAEVLNERYPLLLRIRTDCSEDGESWADFAPSPKPGRTWGDVVFDVSQPVRGVRFTPSSCNRLSLRYENRIGAGEQAFEVEIKTIRLGAPEAKSTVRRALLRTWLEAVREARLDRYRVLDRVAAEERLIRQIPELWRAYAASFFCPVNRPGYAGERVRCELPAELPAGLSELALQTRFSDADGMPVLHVALSDSLPEDGQLCAELHDSEGNLVASGKARERTLTLAISLAELWAPGAPRHYLLKAAVTRGGVLLSGLQKLVRLRSVRVGPAPVSTTLRHARRRGEPDWSFVWNGLARFPRVACYHWPEQARTVQEGVRMLGDLWTDGLRRYGMSHRPGTWELCESHGISQFASLAPRYGSIKSWFDVRRLARQYEATCRTLRSEVDRGFQDMIQVGNEVELVAWGANLAEALPDALYQPIDVVAETLRREGEPSAPVMYVRAGSFRHVPPLPHEEVCGVNQYTGRYGGRADEVGRDLAELARQGGLAGRPLMITEWNGPKYSWATRGIGGVTRRGAAYYLERYYRAMVGTPGIVGSSEFTLNWIIAPFEDLTNQTREEAWKGRPKHSSFGGGFTADHVPEVGPLDAVRGPCYRSAQGYQSPLYTIANSPGRVAVCFTPQAGAAAERIAVPLRRLGKDVELRPGADVRATALPDAHTIIVSHPGAASPLVGALVGIGLFEPDMKLVGGAPEPVIQRRLHPTAADRLLVLLSAPDTDSFSRGVRRLEASGESLVELAELEGGMTRVLALTDSRLAGVYERYILEFAARGYLHTGDDTRTELDRDEFVDAGGELRVTWQNLGAVIVDAARELSGQELALLDLFLGHGCNLIVTRPCYEASAALRKQFPAEFTGEYELSGHFRLADVARQPIPVNELGAVDLDVIGRFRSEFVGVPELRVTGFHAAEATALAWAADGTPVLAMWQRGGGRAFLFGASCGAAARVHCRVTQSGQTHHLYDRDTACGLERLTRVLVNCCRFGAPERRLLPRLFIDVECGSTVVEPVKGAAVRLRLTDVDGMSVTGELRLRSRLVADGRGGSSTAYRTLTASPEGVYTVMCAAGETSGVSVGAETNTVSFRSSPLSVGELLLSLQFKGRAVGHIPADGAVALVVVPGESRASR